MPSSPPSTSESRTRTSSALRLGRFLPTKSARSGSSRWPRSTSTRELHGAGPAQLEQRVERGAHRAPGEQHVVDEHDHLPRDVGDLGGTEGRDRSQADVVPVEGNVEGPDRHGDTFEGGDRVGEPPGQRDPPGVHPDEHDRLGAVIAFDDLVRDPRQRPPEVGSVEDARAEDEIGIGSGARRDTTLAALARVIGRGVGIGVIAGGVVRIVRVLARVHRFILRGDLTGSPSRSERG